MSAKTSKSRSEWPFYSATDYEWHSSTGHLLANVHHAMRRALDAELARYGDVSSAQWIVVMLLAHETDVTAASLAKRLNYDPGSMTRLLDRLQEKGLLRRVREGDDRRCIRIELTDSGRATAPSMRTAAVNVINQSLTGFSADEHQQVKSLLMRMLENLR